MLQTKRKQRGLRLSGDRRTSRLQNINRMGRVHDLETTFKWRNSPLQRDHSGCVIGRAQTLPCSCTPFDSHICPSLHDSPSLHQCPWICTVSLLLRTSLKAIYLQFHLLLYVSHGQRDSRKMSTMDMYRDLFLRKRAFHMSPPVSQPD